MNASVHTRRPRGYTLIEVLASAGILAAAIGAAAALNVSITKQEEMTRGQMAAIRYAENIARLWQLGMNPASVMLAQTQGAEGSSGSNPMTFTIANPTTTALAGGEGSVEQTTVTVSWLPYGASSQSTISLPVIRPVAAHR